MRDTYFQYKHLIVVSKMYSMKINDFVNSSQMRCFVVNIFFKIYEYTPLSSQNKLIQVIDLRYATNTGILHVFPLMQY